MQSSQNKINNNSEKINKIIEKLRKNNSNIKIMHICGTHERTIAKFGIRSLLPKSINILSGPGCPVCVTPEEDIDAVIILSKKGYNILTYGDMLRVPGSEESLFDARSDGANIDMVYSIDDAIKIALKNENKKYIFFAIGFETTIPTVACVIKKGLPNNLTIYPSLKLTIPAINYLIRETKVDAFIAPGHVATIIGKEPFNIFENLNYPVVIAGFEMEDVLKAILLLTLQMKDKNNNKKITVQNEYSRCVNDNGNKIALNLIDEVFDVIDSNWRGIGIINNSGLNIKEKYKKYNAKVLYENLYKKELKDMNKKSKNKKCICHEILTGKNTPEKCPMFLTSCTPLTPIGACMVSDEGMCFNWYKYRQN